MDEASLTVATTRHRDRMWIFAAREALETAEDTRQRGVPTEEAERTARVIGALGAHAAATAADANDTPVHDDFGCDPTRWHSPDEPGRQLERLLERDQADLEQRVEAAAAATAVEQPVTPGDVDGGPVETADTETGGPAVQAPVDAADALSAGDLAQPRDRWAANAALRAAARRQLDEADPAGNTPDPAEQTAAIEQEAEARRAREDLDRAQRVDPGRGLSL